jgi:hypothetical protein
MIVEFEANGKPYGMILGFEALKVLSEAQAKGSGEFQIIEDVAFVSLNSYGRRKEIGQITRDGLMDLMDDVDTLFKIKDAVEAFSVNFSEKAGAAVKPSKKGKA